MIQKAVDWVINRYNSDRHFRDSSVEIGCVLWQKCETGEVFGGPNRIGNSDGVNIYQDNDRLAILESVNFRNKQRFMGDFHCHIRVSDSWLAHYPSPGDLSQESCLFDLWSLENPIITPQGVLHDLSIHSEVQLIQSLLFGDLFVIARASGPQELFNDLDTQDRMMRTIYRRFNGWHENANLRLGHCSRPFSHRAYVTQVNAELPAINEALVPRGSVRFIPNTKFKSDGPDYLD